MHGPSGVMPVTKKHSKIGLELDCLLNKLFYDLTPPFTVLMLLSVSILLSRLLRGLELAKEAEKLRLSTRELVFLGDRSVSSSLDH